MHIFTEPAAKPASNHKKNTSPAAAIPHLSNSPAAATSHSASQQAAAGPHFTIRPAASPTGPATRLISITLMLMIIMFALPFINSGSTSVWADPSGAAAEAVQETTGVQGGAFEVTDYIFRADVKKDHSYTVEEKIKVSIPDQLQRIEFAIPSGNFRVSDIKLDGSAYKPGTPGETGIVAVTDADSLSEGNHEYSISYRIREYDDRDSSKDMFYFNVLPPEWKQPIGSVDIKLTFESDFPWDDMQCYAGQFGVQDSTNRISFEADEVTKTVTVTGRLVPENFGITIKAQLPEGYWEGMLSGRWAYTAAAFSLAAMALILLLLWFIGGRDPKVVRKTVTKPDLGITPVELGYAFNSSVDIRDVLHMILYFAERGYLRISEYEPKRYRLYKVKEPAGEEKMYRNAYNILFEEVYKGRALEMEDLGERLNLVMRSISDDVAAGFSSADASAFTPLSRAFRAVGAIVLGAGLGLANAFSYLCGYQSINFAESILIGAAASAASLFLSRQIDTRDSSAITSGRLAEIGSGVLLMIPVIYAAIRMFANTGEPLLTAELLVSSVLSGFLIVIMRARGRENAELVSRIRSLRDFIYHPTPKELLENHLADPGYYNDMLIYALAFGAEESWAISFLTLDVPEPDWYTDDIEGHAFTNLRSELTTIDYARDIRSFERTIEAAYTDMQRSAHRR